MKGPMRATLIGGLIVSASLLVAGAGAGEDDEAIIAYRHAVETGVDGATWGRLTREAHVHIGRLVASHGALPPCRRDDTPGSAALLDIVLSTVANPVPVFAVILLPCQPRVKAERARR